MYDEDMPTGSDTSFVVPAYQSMKGDVLFLKGFWQAGMLEVSDSTVELAGDKTTEVIKRVKALVADGKTTIYTTPETYIFAEVSSGGAALFRVSVTKKRSGRQVTRVRVNGVLYPSALRDCTALMRSLEDDFRNSKYWIEIKECYWNHRREEVLEIQKGYPEHAFAGTRSDLYTGVDVDKLLQLFFRSDENILITLGEPGTGKTQLIKKTLYDMVLHKDKNIKVVYTKDINALKSNAFWAELHEEGSDILILDDLDHELTPRDDKESDEENVVSRLLSFSNGVFPVTTKILITSNVAEQKIDKALIRPGRCLDVLHLKPMRIESAKRVWVDMGLEETNFDIAFGELETIVQAHFMSEAARVHSDLVRDYLTDPSISVRDKFVREANKIGGMGFVR